MKSLECHIYVISFKLNPPSRFSDKQLRKQTQTPASKWRSWMLGATAKTESNNDMYSLKLKRTKKHIMCEHQSFPYLKLYHSLDIVSKGHNEQQVWPKNKHISLSQLVTHIPMWFQVSAIRRNAKLCMDFENWTWTLTYRVFTSPITYFGLIMKATHAASLSWVRAERSLSLSSLSFSKIDCHIHIYLPTPPLRQDMTQDQFLSEV